MVGEAGLDARIVIEIERGLVADEGTAGLLAAVIASHIRRVGCPWAVFDGMLGHATGEVVVGLAIAEVEAGFQIRVEAIAEVGDQAFALAGGVVLIAVGVGIGQRHVVIEISQDLPGADLALLIAMAAGGVTHLQFRRGVTGVADVIDSAAQRQRTAIEAIGAAQNFDMLDPQWLEQFIRCAAGAGEGQAIQHRVQPRGVGAGRAVDA